MFYTFSPSSFANNDFFENCPIRLRHQIQCSVATKPSTVKAPKTTAKSEIAMDNGNNFEDHIISLLPDQPKPLCKNRADGPCTDLCPDMQRLVSVITDFRNRAAVDADRAPLPETHNFVQFHAKPTSELQEQLHTSNVRLSEGYIDLLQVICTWSVEEDDGKWYPKVTLNVVDFKYYQNHKRCHDLQITTYVLYLARFIPAATLELITHWQGEVWIPTPGTHDNSKKHTFSFSSIEQGVKKCPINSEEGDLLSEVRNYIFEELPQRVRECSNHTDAFFDLEDLGSTWQYKPSSCGSCEYQDKCVAHALELGCPGRKLDKAESVDGMPRLENGEWHSFVTVELLTDDDDGQLWADDPSKDGANVNVENVTARCYVCNDRWGRPEIINIRLGGDPNRIDSMKSFFDYIAEGELKSTDVFHIARHKVIVRSSLAKRQFVYVLRHVLHCQYDFYWYEDATRMYQPAKPEQRPHVLMDNIVDIPTMARHLLRVPWGGGVSGGGCPFSCDVLFKLLISRDQQPGDDEIARVAQETLGCFLQANSERCGGPLKEELFFRRRPLPQFSDPVTFNSGNVEQLVQFFYWEQSATETEEWNRAFEGALAVKKEDCRRQYFDAAKPVTCSLDSPASYEVLRRALWDCDRSMNYTALPHQFIKMFHHPKSSDNRCSIVLGDDVDALLGSHYDGLVNLKLDGANQVTIKVNDSFLLIPTSDKTDEYWRVRLFQSLCDYANDLRRSLNDAVIAPYLDSLSSSGKLPPKYEFACNPFSISSECRLSGEQVGAAQSLFNSSPVSILWGPPGTGKTKTLACALVAAAVTNAGIRIAVSAITNAAINELFHRMDDVIRENNVSERVTLINLQDEEKEKPSLSVRGSLITVGTIFRFQNYQSTEQSKFDVLAVDEASMYPFTYLAFMAQFLKPIGSHKIVLAGDFLQLQPILAFNNTPSPISRFCGSTLQAFWGDAGTDVVPPPFVFQLNESFRSCPELVSLIGSLYPRGLRSSQPSTDLAVRVYVLRSPSGGSQVRETDIMPSIIDAYKRSLLPRPSALAAKILVVTPHRRQRYSIYCKLSGDNCTIKPKNKSHGKQVYEIATDDGITVIVDTTEKTQGRESDAVVMCYGESVRSDSAFPYNLFRLNVAASRAKRHLFLILDETKFRALRSPDVITPFKLFGEARQNRADQGWGLLKSIVAYARGQNCITYCSSLDSL